MTVGRECIYKYSPNIGLNDFRILHHDERYLLLNEYIKELHSTSKNAKSYRDIYIIMQNLEDKNTDWNYHAYNELIKKCSRLREGWTIDSDLQSEYWDQIKIRKSGPVKPASKIKVYVKTRSGEIKDLYIGAIKELISKGDSGFESKISKKQRDDMACFYVRKNEFYILEKYFRNHAEELILGNRFVANRGLIGVSRDLVDIDSHNAQQAKIIWDYFGMIDETREVDIGDMYRMFVLGWNANLPSNNPFYKDFAKCTAQSFVILMDTLDVILGRAEILDESLLLNDEVEIWGLLESSRSWEDFDKQLAEMKK